MKVLFIAGFGPIAADVGESRRLYAETLGIRFKVEEGEYLHTEEIEGARAFAIWPLDQAAESCFGRGAWPAVAVRHVHQQAVVPLAGWSQFVLAHQPDWLESHALIGLDCPCVVRGRIDREAMVTALMDQESGQGSNRVRPQAFALPWRPQGDVDG